MAFLPFLLLLQKIHQVHSSDQEAHERANISVYQDDSWDFPGGAVVKNPPANAGDKGSIPGPGRSHMPWSN